MSTRLPPQTPTSECFVIVILKDNGERFFFSFDRESELELTRQLGQMAADPQLNFSWMDATAARWRMRQLLAS